MNAECGVVVGDYLITNLTIGQGLQSTVVKAFHTKTNESLVAKICRFKDNQDKQMFLKEVEILQKLADCKHIVQLKDVVVDQHEGIMLLEMLKTDLMTCIRKRLLTVEQQMYVFEQVCIGVREIHSRNICHLDLKPENILVSADFKTVKICDFGMSTILGKNGLSEVSGGTLLYCAPELFAGWCFKGKKADIWSLGIVYHVLLTSKWPYPTNYSQKQLNEAIQTGRIQINNSLSEQNVLLMKKMTNLNPKSRIDIKSLCYQVNTTPKERLFDFSHLKLFFSR